ncbi:armadillo-type protein [Papiliotrema laurentii]|uniref:Armadillo-type protein n=1 Tax=Papiliotrema laurentii TaxID=5418 RepID=A0AAD9FPJ7_PAPLA|nr:armadillo-type protein [Papiliotrema laurentii]
MTVVRPRRKQVNIAKMRRTLNHLKSPRGGRRERRPLAPLSTNINLNPTIGLASPFVPPDPNGLWGAPQAFPSQTEREVSLVEKLAAAERKIRELTIENEHLRRNRIPMQGISGLISPSMSTHSSMFFDGQSQASMGNPSETSARVFDEDAISYPAPSTIGRTSTAAADYVPPPHMIASILHGTFNFSDMPPEYSRPVVWVVAHCQPRSSMESAGLKTAVNSLATRFTLPRESDSAAILVNSIIEWAKPLCYTSCGNYLCQQLLERGDVDDKLNFIDRIRDEIVAIASDKFGTHVLCKAIAVDELEEPISSALFKHGIFESLKTGARRLWREYLEKCRQGHKSDIFETINREMKGRWAELACINEHGSIAVQQVFEVFGNADLMDPCFKEILADISKVANNQFGHFVITKLIGYPPLYRATCDAILTAYPPVATTHHGVNFSKIALTEGGRASIIKRTPGIVAIATSSIGKAHLTFVISCLTPSEHVRIRQVCRAYSTTLRNSQSGNDLLRALGLIHAVGSRHRSGGT